MELKGRKVLVVGMERSGVASAQLLLSQGARVTAADQRSFEQLGDGAQALRTQNVDFRAQADGRFEQFDLIVLSPGVPADAAPIAAAEQEGVPVIGEVELAFPLLRGRTIGITGSNGKTTTTALIGHIFHQAEVPAQVGGNIGTPVTAMVDASREGQWNVLELSSFQLETTRTFRPDIGVVLNVTQNHLDRHYSMDRYADAKANLLRNQAESDFAVLNTDDPYCRRFRDVGSAQRFWFSSKEEADIFIANGEIRIGGQPLIATEEILIRGRHNHENAMAAAAAAHLAGISIAAIREGIRSFQAVEHRLEFVRRVNGVDFFNDSKATSVDATLKALDAFERGVWIILGGKDKGSDYEPLRKVLAEKGRAALLIGSAAPKIASALDGAIRLVDSGTLESAVHTAFREAREGDTVLLAPACASFDQFQSYEHRGRVFKDLVKTLEGSDLAGEHGATA